MSAVEDIKAASSELVTAPPAKALLRFALPLMAGGACQQLVAEILPFAIPRQVEQRFDTRFAAVFVGCGECADGLGLFVVDFAALER